MMGVSLWLQLHYLFGSTDGQQTRNERRFVERGATSGARLDAIVSVMFWTHVPQPPQVQLHSDLGINQHAVVCSEEHGQPRSTPFQTHGASH